MKYIKRFLGWLRRHPYLDKDELAVMRLLAKYPATINHIAHVLSFDVAHVRRIGQRLEKLGFTNGFKENK